jgi:hypothetical protein
VHYWFAHPDARSAHPVSPRKATPMSTNQTTTSPLNQKRGAGLNEHAEAWVSIQDATRSLLGIPVGSQHRVTEGLVETIVPSKPDHRQFAYPAWPTSTPGPEATLPPPGQKPHPTRTDRIMYESYDQERGMQSIPHPAQSMPARAAQESGERSKRAGRLDPFGRMRHA